MKTNENIKVSKDSEVTNFRLDIHINGLKIKTMAYLGADDAFNDYAYYCESNYVNINDCFQDMFDKITIGLVIKYGDEEITIAETTYEKR